MPSSFQVALALVGTLAGIAYAGFGIVALKHLASANTSDRAVGWSLWWFTEASRYTAPGQALCRKGAVAFVLALASWLAWLAWFVVSKA